MQDGFAAFVTGHRQRLLGVALSVHGDPARAHRMVDAALARLYGSWRRTEDPYGSVLGWLLRDPAALTDTPWAPQSRIQLSDGGAAAPVAHGVVGHLQAVPRPERDTLVLTAVGGLAEGDAARVLGLDRDAVRRGADAARMRLAAADPELGDAGRLRAELAAVVPPAAPDPAADVAHGRTLVRRRRLRAALGVAAAVVVAVLLAVQFRPGAEEPRALAPTPESLPTTLAPTPRPAPACAPPDTACQDAAVEGWLASMSEVVAGHLDPSGRYFYGAVPEQLPSPAFWRGEGGTIAFRMVPAENRSTEVVVEVATSRDVAVRCGERTGTPCDTRRFLDGNRFTLSSGGTLRTGVEVQHRPDGQRVITVLARDRTGRAPLEVGTGELMMVAQDLRLQLPPT